MHNVPNNLGLDGSVKEDSKSIYLLKFLSSLNRENNDLAHRCRTLLRAVQGSKFPGMCSSFIIIRCDFHYFVECAGEKCDREAP